MLREERVGKTALTTRFLSQRFFETKTRTYPIPILLIGNKRDLESGREVSIHEGRALAQELRCGFIETSARDDDNVEKVFYTMVGILRRQAVAAAEQQGSKSGIENFCAEE
ncbi:Ras family protein [Apiospora hydei]|uniref:small monomeric GTPase n=1 Tax=Apiospora hydei TaxID=1337664 RepID=A0ABR1UUP2_9PEZI